MTTIIRRVLAVLLLPVSLFVVWWLASADSTNFLMPPLSRILGVFPDTWLWDRMNHDVAPSLVRLVEGYAAALAIGIAVGVTIGSSRILRSLAEPALEFLRAIPPPALVPVLFLLAGIGDTTKIFIIISGCVWPILLNTVEGCAQRRPGAGGHVPQLPGRWAAPPTDVRTALGEPADRDRGPAGPVGRHHPHGDQ